MCIRDRFYEQHFGMNLVHRLDFPEWKFSVFFLETQPKDEQFKIEFDGASAESEAYLNHMDGATLELTWNHGTESGDIPFEAWNGNTGADADGANHRETPAARGFGHIAFNVDDVYAVCAELEANGVGFQKRPDEGNMKGLAFALDPDGYWLEIVKRTAGVFEEKFNLSQTMLRVKNGPASIQFYTEQLGMKMVKTRHFPQWKFSLYFLASITDEEMAETWAKHKAMFPDLQQGDVLDPDAENCMTSLLWQPCLELTYNHGCESDPDFHVHNGNSDPQGFGHIGFLVDNLESTCESMEAAGVAFKKKPADGNMKSIAFAYDPDGYWVELIDRTSTFSGICANY
eukprot:TRINITY_DN19574_c0_g1_i1.p1 TRINITY_DN19574_c0_g1~~TRINITY_DN19574_c0_g1_i1.p1  ORF type:complete len:343 (+),score=85.82 TRINITY_DN19574_c0_g1_i1:62-1090(+)